MSRKKIIFTSVSAALLAIAPVITPSITAFAAETTQQVSTATSGNTYRKTVPANASVYYLTENGFKRFGNAGSAYQLSGTYDFSQEKTENGITYALIVKNGKSMAWVSVNDLKDPVAIDTKTVDYQKSVSKNASKYYLLNDGFQQAGTVGNLAGTYNITQEKTVGDQTYALLAKNDRGLAWVNVNSLKDNISPDQTTIDKKVSLNSNHPIFYLLDTGFEASNATTNSYTGNYQVTKTVKLDNQEYNLVTIDGKAAFWVLDDAIAMPKAESAEINVSNKKGIIAYIKGAGVAVWRDAGSYVITGKYLPNGSAWDIEKYQDKNGQRWYDLGHNQWLSGKYLVVVDTTKKSNYLNTPWISQYSPVFAPWGCASAAMAMLLKNAGVQNTGTYAWLSHAQNTLPMYPANKDGQKGNVYTGAGFGWVINANGLTEFGRRYSSRVVNVSGSSINTIASLVKDGHPVLYYGYSSYDGSGARNHCKVIVGFNPNLGFAVHDPLYFPGKTAAGQGGHNRWDMGAIHWENLSTFGQEYNGSAITIQ